METENLDFGKALLALREGGEVDRYGWPSFVMHLRMSAEGDEIYMERQVHGDGESVTHWQPNQEDLLARDWRIVG